MKRPTARKLAGAALTLTLLAAGWLLFAPAQLGGSSSYAVVYGSSMEPGLEAGDLAILRASDDYGVGDVAAYVSPTIGRVVMHRIVRKEGDRYQFKGDNNGFLDLSKPERVELVGKLWLHVPAVGGVLTWLRQPLHAALLTGLLAILLLGGFGASSERRRKPGSGVELGQASVETLLVASGAAVVVCALIAVVAFTRPVAHAAPDEGRYTQTGRFAYSASVPASPVYPAGRVVSGNTVFVGLVPTLRVRFDYRLSAQEPAVVSGTAALVARLRGDNGWQRWITLRPARPFRGDSVSLGGTLRLSELVELGRRVQELTGARSDGYALSIVPDVTVRGHVGGQALDDRFTQRLDFRLDDSALRLDTQGSDSLVRTKAGSGTQLQDVRLSVLGFDVRVETLRTLALLGLLAALLGLGYGALQLRRGRDGDEPDRIALRYGDSMIDVAPRRREEASVVDVVSMEGLARLAERYGRIILHEQLNGAHAYVVEEEGIVYRYTSGGGVPPRPLARRPRTRDDVPPVRELQG